MLDKKDARAQLNRLKQTHKGIHTQFSSYSCRDNLQPLVNWLGRELDTFKGEAFELLTPKGKADLNDMIRQQQRMAADLRASA